MLRKLGLMLWELLRDKTDERNLTRAKMTREEVAEKAKSVAKDEGWQGFDQNEPRLFMDDSENRLVWDVYFSIKGMEQAYKGGHARIIIDDGTGKVLRKFQVPY